MSSIELTESQRARLQNPRGEHYGSEEWYGSETALRGHDGDGRRKVTLPMCNAIRAAADDGLSYRKIDRVLSCSSSTSNAWLHATGRCVHGNGDYPPVEPAREPGPPGLVSPSRCYRLREGVRNGDFQSYEHAGEQLGMSTATVQRHVEGRCSHDVPAVEPPADLPTALAERREAADLYQYELADELGVDRTTITKWETGDRAMHPCLQFKVDRMLPEANSATTANQEGRAIGD